MCKFIGKSNERILCKLSGSEILRLYSIVHNAMETFRKRQILPVNQNLSSAYYSIHKVQKLCSATLNRALIKSHGTIPFVVKPLRRKTIIKNGLDFED